MLEKFGLLSVNQLAAQIKLTEVWKAINIENYAIRLDPYKPISIDQKFQHTLRTRLNRIFNDDSRLLISKQSFSINPARLWNQAPASVSSALSLSAAKSEILAHVKTLPI